MGLSLTDNRMHYTRAPILEAVIDIHVRLPAAVLLEQLAQIEWGEEHGSFGEPRPRLRGDVRFGGGAEGPTITASQSQIGFTFGDVERTRIVQARLDGFAFSRLAPYDRWEPFCEEARQLWERYCAAVKPLGVTRVAVRYINRLELPLPLKNFRNYLRTFPEVSPDLPQGLSSFLMQLQIPQEDIADGVLILNEGILESTDPNVAAVLLDIDLFRPVAMPVSGTDVWDALEELHNRKNEVFEASITDRTRELIR